MQKRDMGKALDHALTDAALTIDDQGRQRLLTYLDNFGMAPPSITTDDIARFCARRLAQEALVRVVMADENGFDLKASNAVALADVNKLLSAGPVIVQMIEARADKKMEEMGFLKPDAAIRAFDFALEKSGVSIDEDARKLAIKLIEHPQTVKAMETMDHLAYELSTKALVRGMSVSGNPDPADYNRISRKDAETVCGGYLAKYDARTRMAEDFANALSRGGTLAELLPVFVLPGPDQPKP